MIGQKIVQAIKNRLHEYGFDTTPLAQSMCIGLANDVKKIMDEEYERKKDNAFEH